MAEITCRFTFIDILLDDEDWAARLKQRSLLTFINHPEGPIPLILEDTLNHTVILEIPVSFEMYFLIK